MCAAHQPTVRLLELRGVDETVPELRFDPALTVIAGVAPDRATRLARALARAVRGPRPIEVRGTATVGEATVGLDDLPAGPQVRVVDPAAVRTRVPRLLDVLVGAQTPPRPDGLAALTRARARHAELGAQLEALRAEAQRLEDELASAPGRIERLEAALDACARARRNEPDDATREPVSRGDRPHEASAPDPERAWAAVVEARRSRATVVPAPALDAGAVAEIEEAHGALEQAERDLAAARWGRRKPARVRVDEARTWAATVLARHGFPSRAAYLVARSEGSPPRDGGGPRPRGPAVGERVAVVEEILSEQGIPVPAGADPVDVARDWITDARAQLPELGRQLAALDREYGPGCAAQLDEAARAVADLERGARDGHGLRPHPDERVADPGAEDVGSARALRELLDDAAPGPVVVARPEEIGPEDAVVATLRAAAGTVQVVVVTAEPPGAPWVRALGGRVVEWAPPSESPAAGDPAARPALVSLPSSTSTSARTGGDARHPVDRVVDLVAVERRERAEHAAGRIGPRAERGALAACGRHRAVETVMRCARCGGPRCERCLVETGGRSGLVCVDCALAMAGTRARRVPRRTARGR